PDQIDLTARNGGGHREHARVDAVRHDRVLDGRELVDTLDGDEAGAATGDLRPHAPEESDDIEDLGLERAVLDLRGATGEAGGHDEVLGAGVRGRIAVQRA